VAALAEVDPALAEQARASFVAAAASAPPWQR
jgi:hypothetical protein